jgi:hypothetical protein
VRGQNVWEPPGSRRVYGRMRRWLLHFAAAVSLLLAIAAAVLWTRSYWRIDAMEAHSAVVPGNTAYGGATISAYGRMELIVWTHQLPANWATDAAGWKHEAFESAVIPRSSRDDYLRAIGAEPFLGFAWKRHAQPVTFTGPGPSPAPRQAIAVVVPYWAPAIAASALPMWWLWRRRRKSGVCASCGYDLRGTQPTSACPECGAMRPTRVTRSTRAISRRY